jgi:hypothetical protein
MTRSNWKRQADRNGFRHENRLKSMPDFKSRALPGAVPISGAEIVRNPRRISFPGGK